MKYLVISCRLKGDVEGTRGVAEKKRQGGKPAVYVYYLLGMSDPASPVTLWAYRMDAL